MTVRTGGGCPQKYFSAERKLLTHFSCWILGGGGVRGGAEGSSGIIRSVQMAKAEALTSLQDVFGLSEKNP